MTASSALLPIPHIFLCYILFSSINKQPFGLGARLVEKNQSKAPPTPCSGPEKGLRAVHNYGPCSAFGHKKSAAASSQILVQDERRVRVINSGSYNTRTVTTSGEGTRDTDLLNDSIGGAKYLVNVSFGTPPQNFNLILDTGSYVTWVRCQRCSGSVCPQQDSKLFYNPSTSSTSSNAPCFPRCEFNLFYADNTESDGSFVADALSIEQDHFSNFVFLCADKEKGELSHVDGILGLGLGSTQNVDDFLDYALTSQTETVFKNVFCHCLPTSENSIYGHVYFGEEAQEKCPFSGSYTPLRRETSGDANTVSKYFVDLIAITIGQRRVEVSSDAISSSPGTIMDSGTVITRLPSSVYSELQSEFKTLMSGFNLALPPDESENVLDTCYNLEGYDNSVIPSMTLHFQNLDLDLDPTAVTWKGNRDMSQVCLAFAGNKKDTDFTIIGNHQQQSRNILYNIPEQRLEIGPPGHC